MKTRKRNAPRFRLVPAMAVAIASLALFPVFGRMSIAAPSILMPQSTVEASGGGSGHVTAGWDLKRSRPGL